MTGDAGTLARRTQAGEVRRPRLGFLGLGWIGRQRMASMLEAAEVEAAAIADPAEEARAAALALAPHAEVAPGLDELLRLDLDGLVIATPSALHARQAIAALEHGLAVFCQKPLARTAEEARAVVAAARSADRLLGVDLCYRFTRAMEQVKAEIEAGALGRVFAADLTFHNAYGPDKPWFHDPALSGGGCVIDLGVHLVDLALWALGFPGVTAVSSSLVAGGERLGPDPGRVEDFATATLELQTGAVVRLACSWNLAAGCDARIEAAFYGAAGGAAMRNLDGSFYDFIAERFEGRQRRELATPPDAWMGRAAADWAGRLAAGARFDPAADEFVAVAEVLDRIYGRASRSRISSSTN